MHERKKYSVTKFTTDCTNVVRSSQVPICTVQCVMWIINQSDLIYHFFGPSVRFSYCPTEPYEGIAKHTQVGFFLRT